MTSTPTPVQPAPDGFLRRRWRRFRALPVWGQIVIVVLVVVSIAALNAVGGGGENGDVQSSSDQEAGGISTATTNASVTEAPTTTPLATTRQPTPTSTSESEAPEVSPTALEFSACDEFVPPTASSLPDWWECRKAGATIYISETLTAEAAYEEVSASSDFNPLAAVLFAIDGGGVLTTQGQATNQSQVMSAHFPA